MKLLYSGLGFRAHWFWHCRRAVAADEESSNQSHLARVRLARFGGSLWCSDAVHPPDMKAKQIPDDFRDWIESRTFEIVAPVAWPPQLPMDYLKGTIYSRTPSKCSHCQPMARARVASAFVHRAARRSGQSRRRRRFVARRRQRRCESCAPKAEFSNRKVTSGFAHCTTDRLTLWRALRRWM